MGEYAQKREEAVCLADWSARLGSSDVCPHDIFRKSRAKQTDYGRHDCLFRCDMDDGWGVLRVGDVSYHREEISEILSIEKAG